MNLVSARTPTPVSTGRPAGSRPAVSPEGEYFRMFDNLAGYSRISLARLLDYARERRPAGLELQRHIKAEFLKNSALAGSDDKP